MKRTFLFLQKLLNDTIAVPLWQVPCDQAMLTDLLQSKLRYAYDSVSHESSILYQRLLSLPQQGETLCQWFLPGGISLLLYPVADRDIIYGIGPVLTQPFSRESCLHSLSKLPITPDAKQRILEVCSRLPVTEPRTLYKTGDLVFGYLSGKDFPLRIIQLNPPVPDTPPEPTVFSADADISQMRQVETRYEYSATLTDAVKQGNLSLAMHFLQNYDPGKQTQVRNANPLRNAQNYCIVLNTQLRHALEESGIHPYQVDRLSSQIGLEIEQLKSTRQLPQFFQQVVRRYCRLVQEHAYPRLKPLTNLAVTYIKEHLADNLTVKETAKALTVNANYLSTLFHQDMGMTFIDFVNQERTRQAAALLRHTNLQIQQIAATVGYNNTSYFAKQFLRFHSITPSHYRRGDAL